MECAAQRKAPADDRGSVLNRARVQPGKGDVTNIDCLRRLFVFSRPLWILPGAQNGVSAVVDFQAEKTGIATAAVSQCAMQARIPDPLAAKCFGSPSNAWARQM